MTRKQAISKAIEKLSQSTENEEVVLILREILGEMPLSQWTQKSIIDSIEEYVLDNGCLPITTQLINENRLPSRTAIENKFGVTSVVDFYKEYFPNYPIQTQNSSPYKYKGTEYFVETFKRNYDRIQKELNAKQVYASMYDKNRERDTPLQTTICEKCGCKSYNELLVLCGYAKPQMPMTSSLNVSYTINGEAINDELKNMINEIKKTKNRKK